MKLLDIVFDFGDKQIQKINGICRVRSYICKNSIVVILTELCELNDGASVTNSVEKIINLLTKNGLVIQPAIFIEHYERDRYEHDTFDIVNIYPETNWESITKEKVVELTGCDEDEFCERSINNRRIYEQVDKIKYSRNPFHDSIDIEDHNISARKLEIIDSMVKKSVINELIESKAKERDIQQLIKKDLSLMAEAYVNNDEYICFSEYPLEDGFVDFVIFTGRSRMEIILIEVKGADFPLVNQDNYGAFNHKVTNAAEQIQNRLGSVLRNYENFRKSAHEKRNQVLSGDLIHNAFVGPCSCKEVDPNKDVNIRSIVIGGRTKNDIKESKKRHDYEVHFTPPVRIESWDTWLRRLKRQ